MGAASKWCALMSEASISFSLYHIALAVGATVLRNDPDDGREFLMPTPHDVPPHARQTDDKMRTTCFMARLLFDLQFDRLDKGVDPARDTGIDPARGGLIPVSAKF